VRIIRVFPRRTKATPDDDLVRIGCAPDLFDEADEVHVSCTFSWDLPLAEKLVKAWSPVAPTFLGGGATGMQSGEFIPGMYLKHGYTITSRGCNNTGCWHCSVPKREGKIRELQIKEGWNILDDNLLQCSEQHIKAVFSMLSRQKTNVQFTGGLDPNAFRDWHCEELSRIRLDQLFTAYDTPDDLEPVIAMGKLLQQINVTYSNRKARCYVLCGYPSDTFDKAEKRMIQTVQAGFMPMAMLYRDKAGHRKQEWMKWQRLWARPAIISNRVKLFNPSC